MTAIPLSIKIPVAWGDMDTFGHVNNTIYLRWFESARIALFEAVKIPHRDVSHAQGPILARTSCTFERPLTYPDTVQVQCTVGTIGTKSFTTLYEVVSLTHDERAAHGDGVVVWYDYSKTSSVPIPQPLRAQLNDHQFEA